MIQARIKSRKKAAAKRRTSFEKEPWYAAMAQRISAARNTVKDAPPLAPADSEPDR